MDHEVTEASDLKDSANIEPSPSKGRRAHYIAKVRLLFKTIFILSDQLYDIILFFTLLFSKEYWCAVFFLIVDLLPGFLNLYKLMLCNVNPNVTEQNLM